MPLWKETPLIRSAYISDLLGCAAYLKLETVHPSYSFKYRGISWFVEKAVEKHGSGVHLVIASGGNAALACAVATQQLGVKCSVFIPAGSSPRIQSFLKQAKANVVLGGQNYPEALISAQRAVEQDPNAVMVPAYDCGTVWEGHASMIKEIDNQLDTKPDAVFCSVGGAGLLGGIIEGMESVGWDDVPVVSMETIGSNCFHYSVDLNKPGETHLQLPDYVDQVTSTSSSGKSLKLAHFNEFRSLASTSLGAQEPSASVVEKALKRQGGIRCVSVPDPMSMKAAVAFADDHKLLVELSCSTTLAPAYYSKLFDKVLPTQDKDPERTVVFIVCGGFKVSLADLASYERVVEETMARGAELTCIIDGEEVRILL